MQTTYDQAYLPYAGVRDLLRERLNNRLKNSVPPLIKTSSVVAPR
jgi:hypothetical protein